MTGILISLLVVFTCDFFTISVGTHVLPHQFGGFEVTAYEISLGLFRYGIAFDSVDFADSAQCRSYDDGFIDTNFNTTFMYGLFSAAQLLSTLGPILAMIGCLVVFFELCICRFNRALWIISITWFLAFVFQTTSSSPRSAATSFAGCDNLSARGLS